jgi:hypothetical protein
VLALNAEHMEAARRALGVLNWAGEKLLSAAHRARANTIEGA